MNLDISLCKDKTCPWKNKCERFINLKYLNENKSESVIIYSVSNYKYNHYLEICNDLRYIS